MNRKPIIHELKILPEYYLEVLNGNKTFEVRKADRDYRVGDTLSLQQLDVETQRLFGSPLYVRVTYILKGGQFGIDNDYVVMGIRHD